MSLHTRALDSHDLYQHTGAEILFLGRAFLELHGDMYTLTLVKANPELVEHLIKEYGANSRSYWNDYKERAPNTWEKAKGSGRATISSYVMPLTDNRTIQFYSDIKTVVVAEIGRFLRTS